MSDDTRNQSAPGNVRDHDGSRRTRRRYSAEYKIRILAEYDALDRHGKGRLLIREGLYTSLLSQWRHQRDEGARAALTATPGRPPVDLVGRENARLRSRVQQLQAELKRSRQVIESQTTLTAMLDELTPDNQQ